MPHPLRDPVSRHRIDVALSLNLRGTPPLDPAAMLEDWLRRLELSAARVHALDLPGRQKELRDR